MVNAISLTKQEAASNFGNDMVYMEKYLENPLSMELLKGAISEGGKVRAEAEDDTLVFRTV